MADEKKEPWLNYLALTTVVFAVCATLSTLKGGGFSTRAVMSQSQASDQWSYFQAKSIKGYLYELQKEKLELDAKTMKGGSLKADFDKRIAAYGEKIKRYDEEKKEIKGKAEDLEARRDLSQQHSGAFGMAAMFLVRWPGRRLFRSFVLLQRILPVYEVAEKAEYSRRSADRLFC
jgi:hypothetical protein